MSLSSAVQHQTAGPPSTSSSPTAQSPPPTPSSSFTEGDVDVAFGTHGTSAEFGGNANVAMSSQPALVFTSVPTLGSPLQSYGQPLSRNIAAVAEDDDSSLEIQALQPYDSLPVNVSVVTAMARKNAVNSLICNSLSLAAAIDDADRPDVEATPGPAGDISLVCLHCVLTSSCVLCLADCLYVCMYACV